MEKAFALLVFDVTNHFCEGGSLGCQGPRTVVAGITAFIAARESGYAVVLASHDSHGADSNNGGYFPPHGKTPGFATYWPVQCVVGRAGADYHRGQRLPERTVHLKKEQGVPAYSMLEGHSDDGQTVEEILQSVGVTQADVVGIDTDHCVRATPLDAREAGFEVRVKNDLIIAVSPETEETARQEMAEAGVVFAQD